MSQGLEAKPGDETEGSDGFEALRVANAWKAQLDLEQKLSLKKN